MLFVFSQTEADRQVEQAQGTAVSITQAAAAIIGTFIGSSILTILVVLLVLRYRRKKRNNRDQYRDGDRSTSAASGRSGGGGYYGGGEKRPESYNSMADSMVMFGDGVQEKKVPLMSPESDTTKVGGLSRMGTTTSRAMEGNNGNSEGRYNKQQNNTTASTGPSEPTGEAITVNYVRNVKQSDRKPIKLSDPPPAKPKKAKMSAPTTAAVNNNNIVSDDEDDERDNPPGDSGKWNLFPKVDPSPKRVSRSHLNPFAGKQASSAAAKAATTTTKDAQQQQVAGRPNSSLQTPLNLQKWLQTATTMSPFGPLDNNDKSSNNDQRAQAANPTAGGGRGRLPANVRLSEVKWPLQDNGTSGPTRSESNGGMTAGTRGGDSGQVVVRNNNAAKTVPKPVVGLPGPVRKLPLRDR